MSRSSDDFIRQKSLSNLINSKYNFTIPFIVLLLSEYVIEILTEFFELAVDSVYTKIETLLKNNPDYQKTFKSKIISYWNEYCRKPLSTNNKFYPDFRDYVGYKILQKTVKNA